MQSLASTRQGRFIFILALGAAHYLADCLIWSEQNSDLVWYERGVSTGLLGFPVTVLLVAIAFVELAWRNSR